MKTFYFIGGPIAGYSQEFFRRLNEIGGAPRGWRIYPHASEDGKALHIAEVETKDEIVAHLSHFDGIYERSEIVQVIEIVP